MNNGKFIWLCGEFLILVNITPKIRLGESKSDYKMELNRDSLILSYNGMGVPLKDEHVSVYRLNEGVALSEAKSVDDYGQVALSIDMFTGVNDLLTLPYSLIHVEIA